MRCFESSDHTDHVVFVHISAGNNGCCDCGDAEAWRTPVKCAIHTLLPQHSHPSSSTPARSGSRLPRDLIDGIRSTIARSLDYLCDVISCSPEQLRLPKSKEAIENDEDASRLTLKGYGVEDDPSPTEYALVLWNDEKHTMEEVEDQIARACKKTKAFGGERASETHFIGRSIVVYSTSIDKLLGYSKIIEQIKVTVTIRSARDIYREQMCGTIIEWLGDIAGASVGEDHDILRTTVCEELLGVWRVGSKAANTQVGQKGIDDHSVDEQMSTGLLGRRVIVPMVIMAAVGGDTEMEMDLDPSLEGDDDEDDVDMVGSEISLFEHLPGPNQQNTQPQEQVTQSPEPEVQAEESDSQEMSDGLPRIPKTPGTHHSRRPGPPVPSYWVETPRGYNRRHPLPPHEDLRQRVRLDWLLLFDLRLWKKARIGLRDLYISTVVAIPEFKRLLGLRFAGLYTILSQLYLVPDREPDHSIINLSLQILTTPSITAEVVERGNFLTNQMAILYTFLTTRQVGHPREVNKDATLSFDAGSLTNRRMFHFFMDLRYLFGSPYVQERLREEERYTLQFLDLVGLHQGICPNVRAVGDHLEYEVEAWISASLVTREINRLARQFSEAFRWSDDPFDRSLQRAIVSAARYAATYSLGWERSRFEQAEIKGHVEFKHLPPFEFDRFRCSYQVVDFAVDRQPVSFHHALHYTLSWLIEAGKNMPARQLQRLLTMEWEHLLREADPLFTELSPEDVGMAMFDIPLRVCVWLSQMRTGMWVRNGFSLRHQMQSYKSVSQRDLTHNRDVFLLQTAMVTVNPSRMLATMIDRFNLLSWVDGSFHVPHGYEEVQFLDLAEDFLHLLIAILSDRLPLIPPQAEPNIQILKLKRELVHILCFKPMQFSELCNRLPEKLQDHEKFQAILTEMTNFRAPDGLSDSGTFELKDEYQDEVDPYIMQFSRNQREEMESAYCARVARNTGQPASEVVFEPKLRDIYCGVFPDIAAFTRTPLFAQIIYCSLRFGFQFRACTPSIAEGRVETFLQLCLHLCQLAVLEERSAAGLKQGESFTLYALQNGVSGDADPLHQTTVSLLYELSKVETLKACRPKINNILRLMRETQPGAFSVVTGWAPGTGAGMDTQSEPNATKGEAERKKQLARERQARIMAQMKQQQQNFMSSSGLDFGDEDLSDCGHDGDELEAEKKYWKYPTGTCILCQEEMNDSRIYGSLALISNSDILRQTPILDSRYVFEVATSPNSLDRPADDIRPFGVASMNKDSVPKVAADGTEVIAKRQGLGWGFPYGNVESGPVATGCSHVMHFSCFENYHESTRRRHPHQIAREHPERIEFKEFVCPLCKALGNAFLPIIWRPKEEASIGVLAPTTSFAGWVEEQLGSTGIKSEKAVERDGQDRNSVTRCQEIFHAYGWSVMTPLVASKLQQLSTMYADSKFPELAVGRSSPSHNVGETATIPRPPAPVPPAAPLPPAHVLPVVVPLVAVLPVAGPSASQTEADELHKIYRRLRNTLLTNKISTRYPANTDSRGPASSSTDLTHCDSLAKLLGFSIAAVEIAQRGVGSKPGSILLDSISEQNLTHLKILSETVSSYFAVGVLQGGEKNKTVLQFREMQHRQMQQLLVGYLQLYQESARYKMLTTVPSIFISDVFVFLAECSVCLVPAMGFDIMHVVRLCYMAEILKTVIGICNAGGFERLLAEWDRAGKLGTVQANTATPSPSQLHNFQDFLKCFGQFSNRGNYFSRIGTFIALRALVIKYTLPFLRKVAILLHVRYGIVFPDTGFDGMHLPEDVRLTKALQLPSFDEMISSTLGGDENDKRFRMLISTWAIQVRCQKDTFTLPHPTIFELVGLPLRYDTLVDEAMRRRCPNSGKELADPSVCLFCGEIFCSQAVCCANQGKGGCNQHLEKYALFSPQIINQLTLPLY